MSSFNRPKTSYSLSGTQEFTLKNSRGFTVFSVNDLGDIKRKGKDIKL